jgi:hypothetical protein
MIEAPLLRIFLLASPGGLFGCYQHCRGAAAYRCLDDKKLHF